MTTSKSIKRTSLKAKALKRKLSTTKIIFPSFLKAIKKGDLKTIRQAKKQKYKINLYWLVENNKKVKPKIVQYLLKNGMVSKSTKNIGNLLDKLKKK
jgi:hypothetical protein